MKISCFEFSKCPALCKATYITDDGAMKVAFAYGFATCYTCTEFILKQMAWESEDKKKEPQTGEEAIKEKG